MTDDPPLPAVDLASAETVFEPEGDGEGHWVGAPSVQRHDGTVYLGVRWRDPGRRGHAVAVYERTGSGTYEERARITAGALGVVSVERPALVTDPRTGALQCYLPVDRDENDWRILKLDDAAAPSAFDPATARTVLSPAPGTTDRVTVKDPVVVPVDGRYHMFYAGHDGTSEQAHLATSPDGETWRRVDANPVLGRSGWHDHHTRVSAVVPAPDDRGWLVFYGGSGTADYGATWNLRTGVAVADELSHPVDATPDAPWLSGPTADGATGLSTFGTCRYLDLLVGDGELELFAEVARDDGAFELRHATVPWPPTA